MTSMMSDQTKVTKRGEALNRIDLLAIAGAAGDMEAAAQVIAGLEPLLIRELGRIIRGVPRFHELHDDLLSEMKYAILKWMPRYKPGYRASTYLVKCATCRLRSVLNDLPGMAGIRIPRHHYSTAGGLPARERKLLAASTDVEECAWLAARNEGAEGFEHGLATREQVANGLSRLTLRQRLVIIQRYGLEGTYPRTLAEIGRCMGLSRERVRQIQEKALSQMLASPPPRKRRKSPSKSTIRRRRLKREQKRT